MRVPCRERPHPGEGISELVSVGVGGGGDGGDERGEDGVRTQGLDDGLKVTRGLGVLHWFVKSGCFDFGLVSSHGAHLWRGHHPMGAAALGVHGGVLGDVLAQPADRVGDMLAYFGRDILETCNLVVVPLFEGAGGEEVAACSSSGRDSVEVDAES